MLKEDRIDKYVIQFKIIEITLKNQDKQQHTYFTLQIQYFNHNYTTSSFQYKDHKLDLRTSWPLELIYIPNISHIKPNAPFLKIKIQSCSSSTCFQTTIGTAIIDTLCSKNQKSSKNDQKKHCYSLLFPIFDSYKQISGDIRIKIDFSPNLIKNNRDSTMKKISSLVNKSQNHRKILIVKDKLYYQPIVSKPVYVNLSSDEEEQKQISIQSQEKQMKSLKYKKFHENLQQRQRKQYFEQFKEDISLIQLKFSQQGKGGSDQQLQQINVFNKTPQNSSGTQRQISQVQQNDVPYEYQHLFEKINEINRKYAPLQRIASEDQLQSSLNCYDIDQKIDQESLQKLQQQDENIDIYEKFIKDLRLYHFATNLNTKTQQ